MKFNEIWKGRRWECLTTGEVFTIPDDVKQRDCFFWGEAMIDVGRVDEYYRTMNCQEVLPEDVCTE